MSYFAVFSPKEFIKLILIKTFELLLVLILGITAIYFLFKTIDNENKILISTRSKIQEIKSLHKMEASLKIDYLKIKDHLDTVINFIPTQDKTIKIINFLENIAKETKNTQRIELGEGLEPYKEGLKKLNCKVELTGNFDSFLNYLKKFENSPYFLNMTNVNLIGPIDLGKEGRMSFQTFFIVKEK